MTASQRQERRSRRQQKKLKKTQKIHADVFPFITPEGIPLNLQLASIGDRFGGFIIDQFLIVLGSIVLLFAFWGVKPYIGSERGLTLLILGIFLLRNFYYLFFELRSGGMTPGKKRVKIRVISTQQTPLSVEAIFVRNITRELEFIIAPIALFMPDLLWFGAGGLSRLFASLWLLGVILMPFLNRKRQRIGDIIAGTTVIKIPQEAMIQDLHTITTSDLWSFSNSQLDMYGIYELQVLEEILRRDSKTPNTELDHLWNICDKICAKIDWQGASPKYPKPFLRAFYLALREHHEKAILFGKRQEFKKFGQLEDESATPKWTFSSEQLSVYGAYELEVLEDALIKEFGSDTEQEKNHWLICDKICEKIEWSDPLPKRAKPFLITFQKALTKHLEEEKSLQKWQ